MRAVMRPGVWSVLDPPHLIVVVRRQDGIVDLGSRSWGRILRVGLLLGAVVAINCSGGGDVEVENRCFFGTGGQTTPAPRRFVRWLANKP